VSWQELVGAEDVQLRRSPFEQDRFGVSVDRMVVPGTRPPALARVCEIVRSSEADVVVLRYPAERIDLFAELVGTGRDPVLADTLVYWRLRTGEGRRPVPDPSLETALAPGLPQDVVADLVADVFADYSNHYLANPLFEPRLALDGYVDWATRSVTRGAPVVTSREGRPIAFATLDRQGDHVEVELAGVRTSEQGGGVYGHLFAGVEDVAVAEQVPEVLISTQAHNTGVQRAWARYGLEPVATYLTVHLVRPGLLPRG
jgi:hypothetical protein